MSQNPDKSQSEASKASITFEVFEAFHKQNPDLDNSEYYAQFPTVTQGTVRSWKARAKKGSEALNPSPQPTPSNQSDSSLEGAIDALVVATRIDASLLNGMDEKSKLSFLKNYASRIPQRGSDPNMPIIPTPQGGSKAKLGIDKYITINKGIVELSIPASVAFKSEQNKKLKEIV